MHSRNIRCVSDVYVCSACVSNKAVFTVILCNVGNMLAWAERLLGGEVGSAALYSSVSNKTKHFLQLSYSCRRMA
jgi:hypothetical protein